MARFRIPRIGEGRMPRPPAAFPQVYDAQRRLQANPDDPDALFTVAAWRAVRGEFWQAIDILHALTKLAPGYPGAWRLKARCYRELGQEHMARLCEASDRRYSPPDEFEDEPLPSPSTR